MYKWILEKDIFGEDLDRLQKEIVRQGMEYEITEYIPFEGGIYKFDKNCLFYGSLEFAAQLRKQTECTIFSTPNLYNCTSYYPVFGKYLINGNDYAMFPYGDLLRRKDFILRNFGRGEYDCFFVRPDSGEKLFTGLTMCSKTIESDMEFVERYSAIPKDALIVVAPARNILHEYRFVIHKNLPITGSLYKVKGDLQTREINNRLAEDGGALDFIKKVLSKIKYEADPLWTIDIAQLCSGEFGILEIGGFSCAGLYASNLESIVSVVKGVSNMDKMKSRWSESPSENAINYDAKKLLSEGMKRMRMESELRKQIKQYEELRTKLYLGNPAEEYKEYLRLRKKYGYGRK